MSYADSRKHQTLLFGSVVLRWYRLRRAAAARLGQLNFKIGKLSEKFKSI